MHEMPASRPLAYAALAAVFSSACVMALEEPEYVVLHESDGYEVRRYAPYNVAETVVEGGFKSSGNRAFRILAGYIFGDNRASEKMNMTAPVESRPADEGVTMNMTAPVTSAPAGDEDDAYVYRFVMERKYDFDELPEPTDPRIELGRVPARTMAVHRYSGFWSKGNYEKNEDELMAALEADGVEAVGAPLLARYNGPFTPFFLRRNEVMVEVDWPAPEPKGGD